MGNCTKGQKGGWFIIADHAFGEVENTTSITVFAHEMELHV
jgi:hypothetical protein